MPHARHPALVALDVATVLWFRLPMLALSVWKPGRRNDREMSRMVSEKWFAAGESMFAMQMEAWKQWTALASGRAPAFDARRLGGAGARPVDRRLRANVKRLSRRR